MQSEIEAPLRNLGRRSRVRKALMFAAGWLSFVVGGVGIFVPGLPTTIFWILAALAFMNVNRPMYERIVGHPRFGRAVRLVVEEGRMDRRGKAIALTAMGASALLCLLTLPGPLAKSIAIAAISVGATWVLSLRPVRVPESAPTDPGPGIGGDGRNPPPREAGAPPG